MWIERKRERVRAIGGEMVRVDGGGCRLVARKYCETLRFNGNERRAQPEYNEL